MMDLLPFFVNLLSPQANGGETVAFFPLLLTAAFGLFGAYNQYRTGQEQADAIEAQNEMNAQVAREEVEQASRAESKRMEALRDQQRRRRAAIEVAYAKSGVLLEGTPASVLTRQREVDEYNVQQLHHDGNERRKLSIWAADNAAIAGQAQANAYRNQGKTALIAGVGNTAANVYGLQKQANYTNFKWF